ncbi:hypothetical protein QYS36_20405 [Pseudomonas sp. G34]|uniref:hypothetical protein n=1 Tax=Pseudomonas sp. G34 TaxID=3059083 RepID=UPI002806934C|nr:hypothetical protein [Pseudomonas sp. G34]MDQ7987310.1 hypothetical protein [Pseudomonas sp. G34]
MSFSEYLASLNGYVQERLSSPLLLSFALSWAAWNYKIFFVLFSELEPAEKFDFMRQLYRMPSALLEGALLYPAVSALAFVIAYPFISREILKYSIWQDGLTRKVKAKAAEGRILLPDEAKQLHEHYQAIIRGLESEVERKSEQSDKSKVALEKAEALIVEGKLAIQKLTSERADQVDELNKDYDILQQAHEELNAKHNSNAALLADAMSQAAMLERLLGREKDKVVSLTSELEATKQHVETLMHSVPQRQIFSLDKGLGMGLGPVVEPNLLKGLQDLADRYTSQPNILEKNKEDDS